MINVTLKGGAVKEFEPGVSPADVAKSIGMGLYKSACAARVDGEAVDLRTPLEKDCELEILPAPPAVRRCDQGTWYSFLRLVFSL